MSEFTYQKKIVIFRGAPVKKDTLYIEDLTFQIYLNFLDLAVLHTGEGISQASCLPTLKVQILHALALAVLSPPS